MPNTYLDSYAAIGNREDLINVVTMISPEDTVFKSRVGGTSASNRTHEWQTQALAASNSGNAKVEGSATPFASGDVTVRARLSNVTQIFEKPWSVSYTQQAINVAGVTNEYAEQRRLKTIEIMKDMNSALINQSSATGASNVARTMHGALAAITTNVRVAATNETLNQPLYNRLMQDIWIQGGNPNATYAHGYNKRQISSWTTPVVRNIDASGRKIVNAVDVYDSDFGKQMILLEREMPTTQLMVLQEDMWKVAYLRPLDYREISENGGSQRGRIEVEATIEYRAENSNGKLTGLSVEA